MERKRKAENDPPGISQDATARSKPLNSAQKLLARKRARKGIDVRRDAYHVETLLESTLRLFSCEAEYAGDLARALGRGEDLGYGGFVLRAAVRDAHGYG